MVEKEQKLAVEMKSISKRFGNVQANENVSLQIKAGTIHGIIGENGAGKSTIMRILYGYYQSDSGEIFVNESRVDIVKPKDAIDLGIGMVHQHFMLVYPLTVTENIILGLEPTSGLTINYKKAKESILEISKKYGLIVDPDTKIEDISVGLQQRVEILKLLYRGANILILDEPTAVLTPQETEELFKTLGSLKAQGKTIIIITHKLNEVMAVTDEVTVLKQGKNSGFTKTSETTKEKLAQMMVGREVLLKVERVSSELKDKIIDVKNIKASNKICDEVLKGISFSIRGGEILGLAGIEGNGQSELAEALSGLRPVTQGEIILGGHNIANKTVREIKEDGLSFIPEDRLKRGLILNYSTRDNLILGFHYLPEITKGPFLDFKKMEENAKVLIEKYDVRPRDYSLPVKNFSGGNQQKVIIAREAERNLKFLLAAQPTRGVDIGAIEFIHKKILELKKAGIAILLISAELEEVMTLSDRILVIYEGEIVGEVDPKTTDEKTIGLMMTGGTVEKGIAKSN